MQGTIKVIGAEFNPPRLPVNSNHVSQ